MREHEEFEREWEDDHILKDDREDTTDYKEIRFDPYES
jgi:hypothetical protein